MCLGTEMNLTETTTSTMTTNTVLAGTTQSAPVTVDNNIENNQ